MDDGRYTFTPDGWPHPITLEVRRWHADVRDTQLCFNAGYEPVPKDVLALQARMEQAKAVFQQAPAYAEFKRFHGNMCLYRPMSQQIEVDNVFINFCERYTKQHFPDHNAYRNWRYASNGEGWTVLLTPKKATTT